MEARVEKTMHRFLPALNAVPAPRAEIVGNEFFSRRPPMKFVLVNGRGPRRESFCGWCCEPIGDGYLRELPTRLSYCNYKCYLGHCKIAGSILKEHASASWRPSRTRASARVRDVT